MISNSLFAQCSNWLAEKAGVASIDWAKLAASKKDSVFNPAYMVEYMLPAYERAQKVIDTLTSLQRKPPADIIDAYVVMQSETTSLTRKALEVAFQSVKVNLLALNAVEMNRISIAVYHAFVYHLWMTALISADTHVKALIHRSGIPDAEIAYHASLTTMMFNLIVMLDAIGAFAVLRMKDGVSGLTRRGSLGAVPVAAVVIGVVIVIAFAWGAVAIYQTSLRNDIVKKVCDKAIESGDPTETKNCFDLVNNPESNLASGTVNAVTGVVEKVAIAAMIGAAGYMIVLFGPGIASNLKKTVAAWKAA